MRGMNIGVISDSMGITKRDNAYHHWTVQVAIKIGELYGVIPNVINYGIGGLTTAQIKNNIWRYKYIKNKFDIIFVLCGANDAINLGAGNAVALVDTKANWQLIYSHLKETNPNAHIIFVSPYFANIENPPRPDVLQYIAALADFSGGLNTDGDSILLMDFSVAWENTPEDTIENCYEESYGGNPMYIHVNEAGSIKLCNIAVDFLIANCADKLAKIKA